MDMEAVMTEVFEELQKMELEELERLLPGFWQDYPKPVSDKAKRWFEQAVSMVIDYKRQQTTT